MALAALLKFFPEDGSPYKFPSTCSDTNDEFVLRLDSVLGRFRKHNLFLKASKCSFGFKELELVGKVVSEAGLKVSQQKIQAVLDFPLPTVGKQLKSFLGTVVALYRIICICTLCTCTYTYTYTRYMAYRTLDPRYTLPYIPICVLYHTKLQTLFTISSHHCNLAC